jgi:UDP-N-acetylmuramate dehydrogenase
MALEIKKNIRLAPLTTFKIGGEAEFFCEVKTRAELVEAIKWAQQKNKSYFILAGGSNILVNNNGVAALVIHPVNKKLVIKGERIEVGAGCRLAKAVHTAIGQGLSGLEWAVGIPGTIGGAVVGNAGAFGVSMAEKVETVLIYDSEKKEFKTFSRTDCAFSYRTSIFKKNKSLIVWEVVLKLQKGESSKIKIQQEKYLIARRDRQPNLPSAGSIFKNITLSDLRKADPYLARDAEKEGIVRNGMVSTGWIIQQLGLAGKVMGGAKISLENANFIINTGRATAADVIMLISYIKQQIRDEIGLQLQEEIEYLGFY